MQGAQFCPHCYISVAAGAAAGAGRGARGRAIRVSVICIGVVAIMVIGALALSALRRSVLTAAPPPVATAQVMVAATGLPPTIDARVTPAPTVLPTPAPPTPVPSATALPVIRPGVGPPTPARSTATTQAVTVTAVPRHRPPHPLPAWPPQSAVGMIVTVAGGGTQSDDLERARLLGPTQSGDGARATQAQLGSTLVDIGVDNVGNLYLAEGTDIRKVDHRTGVITLVAGLENTTEGDTGDGGPAQWAQIETDALAVDGAGDLYFEETIITGHFSDGLIDRRIRTIDARTHFVTTVAGSTYRAGTPKAPRGPAQFETPLGALGVDPAGNIFFVGGYGNSTDMYYVQARTGQLVDTSGEYLISGIYPGELATPWMGYSLNFGSLVVRRAGKFDVLYVFDDNNRLHVLQHCMAPAAQCGRYLTIDTVVAGRASTVSALTGRDRPVTGDGHKATGAVLGWASALSIAVDGGGNIFIGDHDHYRIRRVDAGTGMITTVAGTGRWNGSTKPPPDGEIQPYEQGPATRDGVRATQADLDPSNLVFDRAGNLFFVDGANRVRMIRGIGQPRTGR